MITIGTTPLASQDAVKAAIAKIHAERRIMTFMAATGAAAGASSLLWNEAGASATFAGSAFTYAQSMSRQFVGERPIAKFVGPEFAEQAAARAYFLAQKTVVSIGEPRFPIGLSLTAAVATNRTRKGEDQGFICVRTPKGCASVDFLLEKEHLNRTQQGELCEAIMLNTLLWAAGHPQLPLVGDLRVTSKTVVNTGLGLIVKPYGYTLDAIELPADWEAVLIQPDGTLTLDLSSITPEGNVIYPGSFDPLHFGHDEIAATVQNVSGKKVVFEISLSRVGKNDLTLQEAFARAAQFRGVAPVLLTRKTPYFIEKVRRFGTWMIVGADTAERILNPATSNGEEGVKTALAEFRERGVKFYTVPRLKDGKLEWAPGHVPATVTDLFLPITGKWDISSTLLREMAEK